MPQSIAFGQVLCTVYVDGAYVQLEMKRGHLSPEFDPREPARWLDDQQRLIGGRIVVSDRTVYYDAVDEDAPHEEASRVDSYLKRISRLPEVRVGNPGYTRRTRKKEREQKAVDVQLAVDALEWAFARRDGAIALVTGDGDFAPVLEAIRRAGPCAIVLAFQRGTAVDVLTAASDRLEYLPEPTAQWELHD